MSDDIVIVRSQVGLAYEHIHEGQWRQEYGLWCDLPLTDINRNNLTTHRTAIGNRVDYRNIRWAWRGVMTNTIHSDDLDSLERLGLKLAKPEQNWVVVLGSPFEGLTLNGPFPDVTAAAEWADREAMDNPFNRNERWEVVEVTKP